MGGGPSKKHVIRDPLGASWRSSHLHSDVSVTSAFTQSRHIEMLQSSYPPGR